MIRASVFRLDAKECMTLPEGAALAVEPDDLAPTAPVPADQLWFHHPEMQARVALAERDFAEGRSTRTETPGEAQAFLDSLKWRSD